MVLAQQILIGASMGFAMRLAVAAIDFAGEAIGLQMGLGFATFLIPPAPPKLPFSAIFFPCSGCWCYWR